MIEKFKDDDKEMQGKREQLKSMGFSGKEISIIESMAEATGDVLVEKMKDLKMMVKMHEEKIELLKETLDKVFDLGEKIEKKIEILEKRIDNLEIATNTMHTDVHNIKQKRKKHDKK